MVVRDAAARRGSAAALLDVAVAVLIADPAASLGQVAEAAGIGRTTLHKHYATRDDLLRAVAHRAIDRWEQATAGIDGMGDPDGGLRALAEAMVPLGPQLTFLWRTTLFDHDPEILQRWRAIEMQAHQLLTRAAQRGQLRSQVPEFWLLQTFHSLVYVASESVHSGHLAPRDAPGLVVDTFLRGLGAPATSPSPAAPAGTRPEGLPR
jgi:AcrR family transcriptional regulator